MRRISASMMKDDDGHTFSPALREQQREVADLHAKLPALAAEGIAEYDAQARAAGVMLLPAAGFDVVPSDVLVRPARAGRRTVLPHPL